MQTSATAIPRSHRIFYTVILIAALVVAAGGLLAPDVLASTFSWFVLPPLHASFLGAIYLFGTLYMLGCLIARSQVEVRYALPLIAIFTGMLFVVSVLNLGAFDFAKTPVLIWLASYIVYPLLAIALFLRAPRPWPADSASPNLPEWARRFLLVQGGAVSLVAAALFLLPGQVASVWPWPVTQVLAQAYSGPLLAYGLSSLLASRFTTWLEVRSLVPGMLAFTAVTLLASIARSGVFGAFDAVDLIWFASFALAAATLGAMALQLPRGSGRAG